MAQYDFKNTVYFAGMNSVGNVQVAWEESDLWALQVHGYVYRPNFEDL